MDAVLPPMSGRTRRRNWFHCIGEDFDSSNFDLEASGIADLRRHIEGGLQKLAERNPKVPDKTVAEAANTEKQAGQQILDAGANQFVVKPNPAQYVGTPALGTSRAAAAAGISSVGPANAIVDRRRRRFVWSCVAAFLAAWFIAFFRFFLPRVLFEPATVFKIGYPADYALGIDEKYLQKNRIWVDRTPDRLFVIYARCTHLGCTPDWKPAENKFKCPCHGSGYDSEGINFEGPAPRPMDRAHLEVAPDGQIVVDVSHLYSWPKGQRDQFNDRGAHLAA